MKDLFQINAVVLNFQFIKNKKCLLSIKNCTEDWSMLKIQLWNHRNKLDKLQILDVFFFFLNF